jgi:ISXO2-like transposase domain
MMPFGSGGGDVEVDETFIWRDPDARPTPEHAKPSWVEKMKVLGLIDRDTGESRNFAVDSLSAKDVAPILDANIFREARLLTDEAPRYIRYGRRFAAHASVHHASEEYVSRDNPTVHTRTIEAISASSSAAWLASTSITPSTTCTAILPSSISGIATE